MARAKKKSTTKSKKTLTEKELTKEVGFSDFLWETYSLNRKKIHRHYKEITKNILAHNDPSSNPDAFLRLPQFQAFEIYVFLKEYCDNEPLFKIFEDWKNQKGKFEKLEYDTVLNNHNLFKDMNVDVYEKVFERLKSSDLNYTNYIFALTMGTGKTLLMATCIFYEFILSNKFPKDNRYAQNAIIFAPDRTVLESLREIESFPISKVLPKEMADFLTANLNFHFLIESGSTLNTVNGSRFNFIVSNVQKIILKKDNKSGTNQSDRLFGSDPSHHEMSATQRRQMEMVEDETIKTEEQLKTNQRFQKLLRLKQLAIYLDEAHHAFGNGLKKDMSHKLIEMSSLRITINELANKLKESGTQVVACYNYTGTPYVDDQILPDVVYSYHLKEAIDKSFLKKVNVNAYTNSKTKDFLKIVIQDFWENYGENRREGMLPKLAIFSATIEELQDDVLKELEKILIGMGISRDKILVNVGDEKLTKNEDIYEFNRLDTKQSEKQFILLVNKGREGWNCRSLFGVALYREPKSKIFVLQATMRCLRSVDPKQQTAKIYLSKANLDILDKELQKNFRIDLEEFKGLGSNKIPRKTHVRKPLKEIQISQTKKLYSLKFKNSVERLDFDLKSLDLTKYMIQEFKRDALYEDKSHQTEVVDRLDMKEAKIFSEISLFSELARYFSNPIEKNEHYGPNPLDVFQIEEYFTNSKDGIDKILELINQNNNILYEYIIPKFYKYLYEISEHVLKENVKVQLVKDQSEGYDIKCDPEKSASLELEDYKKYGNKSFHLDTYCFDSKPEKKFFDDMLKSKEVKEVYFTGMLTHGQSDFYFQYIDPETHLIRKYYPDFVVHDSRSHYQIVEVKGDNKLEDPNVLAKAKAARESMAENMFYKVISGKQIEGDKSHLIFSTQDAINQDLVEAELDLRIPKSIEESFVNKVKEKLFKSLLPVYSFQAACGKFGYSEDIEEKGWVDVEGKLNDRMFIAQAVGKSMEPLITNGDWLVFETNPVGSRLNKIVLAECNFWTDPESNSSFTLKKYFSKKISGGGENEEIKLIPLNSSFETIDVRKDDPEKSVRVVAEMVGKFDLRSKKIVGMKD